MVGDTLIVEYTLMFEDYLDARGGKEAAPENSDDSFVLAWKLLIPLSGFTLIFWSLFSATILLSGTLIVLVVVVASHFMKRRSAKRRSNEQRSDFQRFSGGNYTFEADAKGWRLCSVHGEETHSWEELFMIKETQRVLYLVTYAGACTLPKAAFTSEDLAQLKTWCQ